MITFVCALINGVSEGISAPHFYPKVVNDNICKWGEDASAHVIELLHGTGCR